MVVDYFVLAVLGAAMSSSIVVALYARHRMDVKFRLSEEERTSQYAALNDRLDQVDRRFELIDKQLLHTEREVARALAECDQLAQKLDSNLLHLKQSIDAGETAQKLLREEQERLLDVIATLQDHISVDRVGDVEQIALTAAHMAGDGLVALDKRSVAAEGTIMHGHYLLMYQLLLDASREIMPTPVCGYHVLEIGTTREKLWPQMSTSRLAAICRSLNYKMLTVDIDERNSLAVKDLAPFYGDSVRYRTLPGQQLLQEWEGELPPYIYIDAYDFEHPGHSDERNARYVELQGAKINEEDCWEMHMQCAVSFVEKCPRKGIVVFDDVFFEDGEWLGKGKLAVPHMLERGFEIIAQTQKTLVLQR